MNNQKQLLSSLFIVLMLIGAASAQELASMPAGERFVDEKGGFSIALPQKPTEISLIDDEDLRGIAFRWVLKEGRISVNCAQYFGPLTFTSAADREKFLKGYLADIVKGNIADSITEAPFALGEFKGKTYSMVTLGRKAQLSVFLAGDKFFDISAMPWANVPNSDALLLYKAANSFSLLPAHAK